jgi:ribonuclease P protein component
VEPSRAALWQRQMRLRLSADFRRVQSRGRRIRTPHLLVLYTRGRAPLSRYGLVVSKKVGNAVTRNRVKRWLRESLRHHRVGVVGTWDVAVIASPRSATAGLAVLDVEVQRALSQLGKGGSRNRPRSNRRRR